MFYSLLDASKILEELKLHDIITIYDVLSDERLLDKYVEQHSGPCPYAYELLCDPYESPGPCFWSTENEIRENFYKEKARLQTEHIKSLCSLLRELIRKKENS